MLSLTIRPIPDKTIDEIIARGTNESEALRWILSHGEDGITGWAHDGKDGIAEMITKAEAGDGKVGFRLLILAIYNQHDWCHDRMTFHALANIQVWAREKGIRKNYPDRDPA